MYCWRGPCESGIEYPGSTKHGVVLFWYGMLNSGLMDGSKAKGVCFFPNTHHLVTKLMPHVKQTSLAEAGKGALFPNEGLCSF